jgi:hypothetical protein
MMCVLFEDDGVEVRGGGDLYKLGGRSMKVREQWSWTRLAVIAHQSLRDGIDLDTVSPVPNPVEDRRESHRMKHH